MHGISLYDSSKKYNGLGVESLDCSNIQHCCANDKTTKTAIPGRKTHVRDISEFKTISRAAVFHVDRLSDKSAIVFQFHSLVLS